MKILSVLLSLSIYFTAIFGDYVVFRSKYFDCFIYRALLDNFIHASIGTLSAWQFFLKVPVTREAWISNVVFCTILSSLIDVDHFIVAKSIYFKDLTNLKQRGFLHCTSLWIMITAVMLLYSLTFRRINIYVLTYMTTIAYASHHIRDANRRGIWFYPFGHTPPLHKYIYLSILSVLPTFLSYIFHYMKPITKNTVVQYSMLV